MESKIIKTVKEWLQGCIEINEKDSEYEILKNLAEIYRLEYAKDNPEKAVQILKIIILIYSSGNPHDRNAIENEFLMVLAKDETPSSLKIHLNSFPEKLKSAFLKTIREN